MQLKFKSGDKVKFLNDVGGGSVIRTEGDDLVFVMIDDGFEVPVKSSDLIKDVDDQFSDSPVEEDTFEEEFDDQEADTIELSDTDLTNPSNAGVNVLLGFVPDRIGNIAISNIHVYIINDSNYGLLYQLGFLDGEIVTNIKTGMLEDNTKIHCGTFDQAKLAKAGQLILQVIPFGNKRYRLNETINHIFEISQIDFYRTKSYKENDYFTGKAIVLDTETFDFEEEIKKLQNSDFSVVLKQKGDVQGSVKKTTPQKDKSNLVEEIDLHIHEIKDDYENLTNGEILNIQLSRFETTLELALKGNQQKIVFIHGVGNGKLKHELRKKLDRKYPDLKYQDASFREYGFGATLVYLK